MRGVLRLDDSPEERERWRVVDEALSEVYMEGWLGTGEGVRTGGAVDAQSNFGFTIFPDAATSTLRYDLKVRQRWHGCGIQVKAWYSSNAGSTNTFNISLIARQTREGQNLGAPLALFTQALTPAGPAVALDVKTWTHVSAAGIISAHYDILTLVFVRSGVADANNGEYWQLKAHYKILEPS